jgi:hypothetical protein
MTVRTTESTVTFKHPFSLPEFEAPQPAGTYRVVTDEEEISGLSFLAFRKVATMLRLPALAGKGAGLGAGKGAGHSEESICIDANELSTALAADERST